MTQTIVSKSNTPLQSPNIHAGMATWLVARGNKNDYGW